MFFRKACVPAVMAVAMAMFAGCTADGRVDEDQARNWYEEMRGNGSVTNDAAPDGYGVYSGGPNWTDGNNTERNTYGMRTDQGGTTLGQDIRNAWDNVKNDVKGMGADQTGVGSRNGR